MSLFDNYFIKFKGSDGSIKEIIVPSRNLKNINLFKGLIEYPEQITEPHIEINDDRITILNNIYLNYESFCTLLEFMIHGCNSTPMDNPFALRAFREAANYCQAEGVLEDFVNQEKQNISAAYFINAHYPAQLIYNAYDGDQSLISEFLKYQCYTPETICSLGYTAQQLSRFNIPASSLRQANVTLNEIIPCYAKTSAVELIGDGFNLLELASHGHSGYGLKCTGINVSQLRRYGFDIKQLKAGGFDAKQLQEAGFDVQQLMKVGFNAGELKKAGFNAGELEKVGFNARQLKKGGFNAQQLKKAGFEASTLIESYFKGNELRDAGFDAAQLKTAYLRLLQKQVNDVHSSIWDVMNSVFSEYNPKSHKSFSPTFYKKISHHLNFFTKDLIDRASDKNWMSVLIAWQLYCSGFNVRELKKANFNIQELKETGFNTQQLKEAGYDAKQLKGAGFEALQLKKAGYDAKQLKGAGFEALQLKKAGYGAKQLKGAGFGALQLKKAGFSIDDLIKAGYTLRDLRGHNKIYSNKKLVTAAKKILAEEHDSELNPALKEMTHANDCCHM